MKKCYKAPLVLDETWKGKIATLSYDFYMFIQLVLFYFFNVAVGGICFLLDKGTGKEIFLNKYIDLISKIGGMTQKQ